MAARRKNPSQPPRGPLRERKTQQRQSFLEREESQIDMSRFFKPWLGNLLLEHKRVEAKTDVQLVHVLRVLFEPSDPNQSEQCPAAILKVTDGCNSIQTIVTAQAAQILRCAGPKFGFSALVGQWIILKNYRVCLKEESEMERCRYYIIIDCFHVLHTMLLAMKEQDCSQEAAVVEKIKEFWLKRLPRPESESSESASVSRLLKGANENRLCTLREHVKDCLCRNIRSPERDPEEMSQAVPQNDDSIAAEDSSPQSFYTAAESNDLDDALENPWDELPGITLTSSSENSGPPPSLPHAQQGLLTNPPREKASCPNSSSQDFVESQSNSEPLGPEVTEPSAVAPQHNVTSLEEALSQESRALQVDIAHSSLPGPDQSVSCGHPPQNPCSPSAMRPLPPAHPSRGPFGRNAGAKCAANLQRSQMGVRSRGEEVPETGNRTRAAVKRKHTAMAEEGNPQETWHGSTCTRQDALEGPPGAAVLPPPSNLAKPRAQKPPLTFSRVPKRSRMEKLSCVQESWVSVGSRRPEKKKQGRAGGKARRLERQQGVPRLECVRGPSFYAKYKTPTPELCAQVRSIRISRALLDWARWVFNH